MMFFMLPAWGMSNAASTLVGQNLGAQRIDRAEESVIKRSVQCIVYAFCFSVVFFSVTGWSLSSRRTKLLSCKDINALQIMSAGYIFYGIGMVMINTFNGAGDTWTPTWVNLVGFWLFQVPLAWFLAKTPGYGP